MSDQFTDKTISCIDCKTDFVFDAGEQAFFQSREFTEPKRCPKCRKARKQSRGPSGGNR